MKIIKSSLAGFCFGVRRAVDIIYEELEKNTHKIYTLGKIIHNDDFNAELEEKGVEIISADELDKVNPENSVVILRAHGSLVQTYEELKRRGIRYIDTTCPYVAKIQNIASSEKSEDTQVFIIGDRDHPEIQSICSFARLGIENDNVHVFKDASELEEHSRKFNHLYDKRTILFAQTTQKIDEWKKCLNIARKLYTNLTIFDTICNVTEKRQLDAEAISKEVDLMLVIGGTDSSNTKKLAQITSKNCLTRHIRNASEIPFDIIQPEMAVGITAGASTPDRIIEEVTQNVRSKKS
ncbi:MAG: 4-hydroxy-3-methylbut-2-enyl diphosphate reductase [Ruminococcaceae bacterium]|nr:4-hydroxy-3-methylbut-2-enyl diphosphate reductase [Oscillospiraceae bacterium]